MSSAILVIGSLRRGEYEVILRDGYQIGIILDEVRKTSVPEGLTPICVQSHDFSLPIESLIKKIEVLHRVHRFSILLNLREHYVRATALVAEALGFSGLPVRAVENVLNKTQMRQKLVADLGADCTPQFCEIRNFEQLNHFARRVGYPVILKPARLYGSLFVEKITNADQLLECYNRSRHALKSYCQNLNLFSGEEFFLQAEEFLTGSVHSIDVVIESDGSSHLTPIIDVLTANDFGHSDFSHWIRHALCQLPVSVQQTMGTMALRAVRSLDLQNTVAHVEFIATSNGPKLLEVAARPGGHRNRVLSCTHGIELNLALVRALEKKSVTMTSQPPSPFAIVTPFPLQVRQLRENPNKLPKHLASFAWAEQKSSAGDRIGPARDGYSSSLVVELENADAALVLQEARTLASEGESYL